MANIIIGMNDSMGPAVPPDRTAPPVERLRLPDGRAMAWSAYGDPDGAPC